MAACEVDLQENVNDVSISRTGSRIAVLTSKAVYIYGWNPSKPATGHQLYHSINHAPPMLSARYRQILFVGDEEIYTLCHAKGTSLTVIKIVVGSSKQITVQTSLVDANVRNILTSSNHESVWNQVGNSFHQIGRVEGFPDNPAHDDTTTGKQNSQTTDVAWAEVVATISRPSENASQVMPSSLMVAGQS